MDVAAQFSLNGKTALVTGCNKGIGKAIALAFASAGAHVLGVSASLDPGSSAVGDEIRGLGGRFTGFRADLSDRQQLYSFIDKLNAAEPVVDVLVNNAGMIRRKAAAEHPDADWDQVLSLNLDAPFILSREIGKKMLDRGYGKIIFICSLLSFQGGILVPGYTASKGAVAGLVKALANEWAGRGVAVNGIAPGYIATDNTEGLRTDPVRNKSILDRIPAGRWGTTEDLQGCALFLASRASDYVHGTVITVDGGWMGR